MCIKRFKLTGYFNRYVYGTGVALMNKATILIVIIMVLTACVTVDNIPTSTPIYDDYITLVAETVDLGKQKLYKNEKLTHYVIDGVDSYCSGIVSMSADLYRCFAIENGVLTKGINPTTSQWEALSKPVYLKQVPK